MRPRTVLFGLMLALIAACSSGPAAPEVGSGERVCAEGFCIRVPDGWVVEVGTTYISAHHELAPDTTFLTAGEVNQQAIAEAAGVVWPAPTPEVERAFWSLLESAGAGSFDRSERVLGGAERSWGTHDDGDMWHLLAPTEGTHAVGIELRAPNRSWESHAEFVFDSLVIVP
ncbi:MAG: hypothetical protein KDB69_04250 [Acidimicrobiia bacterium]|nr:hypothetical protein [Acidimicrobiia bacterium]